MTSAFYAPDDALKTWVNTWQHAGKALEEVRRQELESYDYAAHFAALDEMLQWACDHPVERPLTGLIEQQYWFMKWREQLCESGTPGGA